MIQAFIKMTDANFNMRNVIYLTCPISPMLYSTTRGTSGDMERETWLARQDAFVNMFRYLPQETISISLSCKV